MGRKRTHCPRGHGNCGRYAQGNGGVKVEKAGGLLPPGSLSVYSARHPHYAWTGNYEAVLQVQFTGSAGIEYVNPADDPRRQK